MLDKEMLVQTLMHATYLRRRGTQRAMLTMVKRPKREFILILNSPVTISTTGSTHVLSSKYCIVAPTTTQLPKPKVFMLSVAWRPRAFIWFKKVSAAWEVETSEPWTPTKTGIMLAKYMIKRMQEAEAGHSTWPQAKCLVVPCCLQ